MSKAGLQRKAGCTPEVSRLRPSANTQYQIHKLGFENSAALQTLPCQPMQPTTPESCRASPCFAKHKRLLDFITLSTCRVCCAQHHTVCFAQSPAPHSVLCTEPGAHGKMGYCKRSLQHCLRGGSQCSSPADFCVCRRSASAAICAVCAACRAAWRALFSE